MYVYIYLSMYNVLSKYVYMYYLSMYIYLSKYSIYVI